MPSYKATAGAPMAGPGGAEQARHMPITIRHMPLSPLSRRVWPALLAAALMVALLFGFGAVVQGAVSDGALRRQAQAAQSELLQRCRSLHGKDMLAACEASSRVRRAAGASN